MFGYSMPSLTIDAHGPLSTAPPALRIIDGLDYKQQKWMQNCSNASYSRFEGSKYEQICEPSKDYSHE